LEFFISYRYEDRHLAGRVARLLEASGQKCFLAHDSMKISLDFEDEIRRQIDQCTALVAVVTPNFVESIYANQEVGIAMGKAKPIIQLWFPAVDKSKLGFLRSLNAIQTTEEGLNTVISKVLDAAGQQINDSFVRPLEFVEAEKIVDMRLKARKDPYYRALVRPQGLYHMFPISRENVDWFSSNLPELFRGLRTRPSPNGLSFSYDEFYGEVSRSGELCYGEAVAKIDGITIGRPIVILAQLIEYAKRFYEKFGWNEQQQGTVAVVELKLGHVHGQELQREGRLPSLSWKGRCEKPDIIIDKPIPPKDLSNPMPTLESIVVDLLLDFGISISEKEARGYVDSVLGMSAVQAMSN